MLEKERQEKERKEKNRMAEVNRLCQRIAALGFWDSDEAVDEGLNRLSTGKRGENRLKLDAVKDQINYRRRYMQHKFDSPKMTSFSENGVALSVDQLIIKLKVIIQLSKE